MGGKQPFKITIPKTNTNSMINKAKQEDSKQRKEKQGSGARPQEEGK